MADSKHHGDERDSGSPRGDAPEHRATPDNSACMEPAAISAQAGRILGLCDNCELQETCVRHRPEGGVWTCTDYR